MKLRLRRERRRDPDDAPGMEGAIRGGEAPTLRALFTDNPGRRQELCIWMESVGLLLGGVPDRGRVDPFGFSWSLAVWLRNPREMTVGFPWICLDSLVRIWTYQWVTRDFR